MPASIKHLTDKKLNLTSLLARWKDGLYYTAAIVKCDKANKRCLVCFEDGSEVWVNNRDVHLQISLDQLNEDEDIVCCICDDGNSEPPNEIILCDVCQQGYHQKCHNPPVDSSTIDESEEIGDHKDWFCATCSYILNQSNCAKLSATAQKLKKEQDQASTTSTKKVALSPQSQSKSSPSQQGQSRPQRQQQTQKLQQEQQQKPHQHPRQHQQPQPPTPQQPQQESQQESQQQQPIKAASPSNLKPTAKVKQTPAVTNQPAANKTTVGPIKTAPNHAQKQVPYYPLSNQVRIAAAASSSSSAALASMTASSALVVGSPVGRSKQDLVNQSNKSSQRQQRQVTTSANDPGSIEISPIVTNSPPVKHAVRKSSVNFVMPPARQSALPTATRSSLSSNVAVVGAAKATATNDSSSCVGSVSIISSSSIGSVCSSTSAGTASSDVSSLNSSTSVTTSTTTNINNNTNNSSINNSTIVSSITPSTLILASSSTQPIVTGSQQVRGNIKSPGCNSTSSTFTGPHVAIVSKFATWTPDSNKSVVVTTPPKDQNTKTNSYQETTKASNTNISNNNNNDNSTTTPASSSNNNNNNTNNREPHVSSVISNITSEEIDSMGKNLGANINQTAKSTSTNSR